MEEQSKEEKLLERRKKYREMNSEKIKENCKKYWLEKGDQIKLRRKELIECPLCNVKVTRESFFRHKISKSHLLKNEDKEEIKSNENV